MDIPKIEIPALRADVLIVDDTPAKLVAVDFIYSPIIPEILRAKVQVFVDLFYLQRQVLLHNEHLESLVAQRTLALTVEIAERKKTETETLRFKNVLDNTLDMIFMFEPVSLRFVYVNQRALLSMSYSRKELLGMAPYQIKPLIPEAEFWQFITPSVVALLNFNPHIPVGAPK